MRKLTVKREKTFVASAMRVNLYIQDDLSNEVTADGLTFRKLGALKNAAECSFEIECGELVLFASVDDALAKAIKSGRGSPVDVSRTVMDKIVIPAGREDIKISGKSTFNPLKGNPFLFDRNL